MNDYHGDAGPGISFLTRLTLLVRSLAHRLLDHGLVPTLWPCLSLAFLCTCACAWSSWSSCCLVVCVQREVNWDTKTQNLVSNPVPELLGLRTGSIASENIPSVPGAPHTVAKTGGGAAASADIVVKFSGLTNASTGSFGLCVLGNGKVSGDGTGIGITITVGQKGVFGDVSIASGKCQVNQAADTSSSASGGTDASKSTLDAGGKLASSMKLFADETELSVRVLPDRSVADWFVQGGRWAATDGWPGKEPRQPEDSSVLLWSKVAGVSAQVDVYGMGCGWLNPSYTDHPTL